jgi:hypothetical protein
MSEIEMPESARVENFLNMFKDGSMGDPNGYLRGLPLICKHLIASRKARKADMIERQKYFELFGWYDLSRSEQMEDVPRGELILCRSRTESLDLCYYCVEALDEDATAEELEQFFVDYDCYMRVPLSPYPPIELIAEPDETPTH